MYMYISCQQFWGISSYSMNLDAVVVTGLVRHPMYVVVISPPYKMLDFSCMHLCLQHCVHIHARMHTHTYIIYICLSPFKVYAFSPVQL